MTCHVGLATRGCAINFEGGCYSSIKSSHWASLSTRISSKKRTLPRMENRLFILWTLFAFALWGMAHAVGTNSSVSSMESEKMGPMSSLGKMEPISSLETMEPMTSRTNVSNVRAIMDLFLELLKNCC